MKHRRIVVVCTTLITVVIGGITWRTSTSKPGNDVFEKSVATTGNTLALASPSAAPLPQASANGAVGTRNELLASLNHQPIEFYGRVVDQFDVPIAGAEVHAQVIYNTGSSSGVTKRMLVTDSEGNFALVGVVGRTLDFNVVKAGYDFIPQKDAYDYTALVPEHKRHHPDRNKPVLIKMWKFQGSESLIEKHRLTNLIPDGRAYRFDLLDGNIVPSGGDFVIQLYHDRQNAGAQIGRYDWKVELIAVDGGLKEANQRIAHMYIAPAEGYTERFTMDMSARSATWSRGYSGTFYLKVRKNLFSRLSIDIHTIPIGEGSYVNLSWWLNPNPDSRTLEGTRPGE